MSWAAALDADAEAAALDALAEALADDALAEEALAEALLELDAELDAGDEHPTAAANARAHTDATAINLTKRMDFMMIPFPSLPGRFHGNTHVLRFSFGFELVNMAYGHD